MSDLHELLWTLCNKLPTDFAPYGQRNRDTADPCADCSCGCRHFLPLEGDSGADWGVCVNPASPRAGLLTFEHQGCPQFEPVAEGIFATAQQADDPAAPEHGEKLRIDLEALIMALEGWGSDQMQHYLDTETGEIITLMDGDDDYDDWCDKFDADESDRYRAIEKLDAREGFEVMEEFTLGLPESRDRRALVEALSRNKPFRRFKDAVHGDLALRDEWFAFRDRAYAALAREWLAGQGIEPEWIDPRGRAQ